MTGTAAAKRLHIRTYGCQMNVYDSERMADVLRPLGYAMTDSPEDADLVVLNTCHIREKAAEKVYSELGRLKEIRGERLAAGHARSTIVVAGCVAQAQGAEIMARQPAASAWPPTSRLRTSSTGSAARCARRPARPPS